MAEADNVEIYGDGGMVATIKDHPEILERQYDEDEGLAAMAVDPIGLIERGVVAYNHHKKLFKGLGGAMLGGLGFTVGALAFSRPR
jgi:hypothetical protein